MYITYFFYLYIQKCGRPRCFLSLFETIGGYVQVLYKYVHMCTGSFLYCKTLKVTEAINSFMNFFTQIQILIIKRSKAPKCCKIRQCHVTEHQSSQSFSKYCLISLSSTLDEFRQWNFMMGHSAQARFLTKNQLQLNEITKFWVSIK